MQNEDVYEKQAFNLQITHDIVSCLKISSFDPKIFVTYSRKMRIAKVTLQTKNKHPFLMLCRDISGYVWEAGCHKQI